MVPRVGPGNLNRKGQPSRQIQKYCVLGAQHRGRSGALMGRGEDGGRLWGSVGVGRGRHGSAAYF